MKYAHSVEIRVFAKEHDNIGRIVRGLQDLVPFDLASVPIKVETAYGQYDDKIKIITILLEKKTHTTKTVENIMAKLSRNQKNMLWEQRQSRLDEDLNFYIRLDKNKLMEGDFRITDSGKCFWIRFSIAAYPHKRSVAKKIIQQLVD